MLQKYSINELLRRIEKNWPDVNTIENETVLRLIRLNEIVMEKAGGRLAPFGLTQASFEVIATLRSLPHPRQLTPTELYRSILITSGGMTKILKTLEQQGLIERTAHEVDKRSKLVLLTAKGEKMAEESMISVAEGDKQLMATGLDEGELCCLNGLLQKILEKIER